MCEIKKINLFIILYYVYMLPSDLNTCRRGSIFPTLIFLLYAVCYCLVRFVYPNVYVICIITHTNVFTRGSNRAKLLNRRWLENVLGEKCCLHIFSFRVKSFKNKWYIRKSFLLSRKHL